MHGQGHGSRWSRWSRCQRIGFLGKKIENRKPRVWPTIILTGLSGWNLFPSSNSVWPKDVQWFDSTQTTIGFTANLWNTLLGFWNKPNTSGLKRVRRCKTSMNHVVQWSSPIFKGFLGKANWKPYGNFSYAVHCCRLYAKKNCWLFQWCSRQVPFVWLVPVTCCWLIVGRYTSEDYVVKIYMRYT